MSDSTIIYYTSNREEETFEEKIKKKLLETSRGLPIISVSHKPIKLGKNICIGVHNPTNVLLFHQILLGCKEAKTPFVINAEADFLYPPEYFRYKPPSPNKIYRYNNIRVLYKYHWGFFRKKYSEGAQIVGRKYLISLLESALKDISIFEDSPKSRRFNPYWGVPLEMYGGEIPCVTFKTGDSLHKYVSMEREKSKPELPYWGTTTNIRKEMFNIG
ncbi:MAG: hypothetical protein AB1798_16565 [Spirochaetota bacterium]